MNFLHEQTKLYNWKRAAISWVAQLIKKKPNIFFLPTEFEPMDNSKVYLLTFYGIIYALKALWRNQNLHLSINAKKHTDMLKSKKPNSRTGVLVAFAD